LPHGFIRPITAAELPASRAHRELARFERLEHESEATVESLHDSIFGATTSCRSIIGVLRRSIAGYALYFFTSRVFRDLAYAGHLYVRPAFRNKVRSPFHGAVARIGVERGCRVSNGHLNWNSNALEFYRNSAREPWMTGDAAIKLRGPARPCGQSKAMRRHRHESRMALMAPSSVSLLHAMPRNCVSRAFLAARRLSHYRIPSLIVPKRAVYCFCEVGKTAPLIRAISIYC